MQSIVFKNISTLVFFLVFSPSFGLAQEFEQISTGDTCSYFGEGVPESVVLFSSDSEAVGVIDRIVRASGLTQNFDVAAAGVPNAAAIIQGSRRLILYNQQFMQNTRRSTESSWGPISIMAHEVGHHLNGHTLQSGGSRPRLELEADKYSGFILQQLGATLGEAQIAMEKLGSVQGSSTHPAKHDRLAAIASGWTESCDQDSNCSDNELRPTSRRSDPEPTIESSRPGPDSCKYARDGECDEPNLCERGTDTTDCDYQKPNGSEKGGPDSCRYARDGACDEPDLCERGTDTSDCSFRAPNPVSNYPTQQPIYCCDAYGRKWCQITVNPGPVGSPCWCAGVPGSGFICQ